MKTLLVLCLLSHFPLYAQTLDDASSEDLNLETETTEEVEPVEPVEDEDLQMEQEATAQNGKDVLKVECQCPQPMQAEEASPFPSNSVFFMAPQPAPVPEQEVVPKDESIPPGYGGKMRSGYDDTGYKQIQ